MAGPRGGRPQGGSPHDSDSGESMPMIESIGNKICANGNASLDFLRLIREVIATLESNGTFGSVLAKRNNEIMYLKNTAHDATLQQNCTAYFAGLEAAIQQDRQILQAEKDLARIAHELFAAVIKSLLPATTTVSPSRGGGGRRPNRHH